MHGHISAGFWKRLGAFIFDIILINLIIIWPFQTLFENYFSGGGLASSIMVAENSLPLRIYFALFLISILAWLYFSFLEYYVGQTPGMMLFDIEVMSLGGGMSFWKTLLRNCFILPFFPFYIFWIVEPLHLAFYKERFLEKISRTATIMKNKSYVREYNLQKV